MVTRHTNVILSLIVLLAVAGSVVADSLWLDNIETAQKQAKQSKKDLLIYFSGSDFCLACIKLDQEVLTQPAFLKQVQKNYVLVQIDFPKNKPLPAPVKKQNAKLKAQFKKAYKVEAIPTLYLATAQGVPYAKTGARKGGIKAFQDHLAFLRRAKPMQNPERQWLEDMEIAKAKAAYFGKDLLIDFTGSDWCGWCIRLDNEIFSKEAFQVKASKEFVFVKLDFPRGKKQTDRIARQNNQIASEFVNKYGYDQSFPAIYLATAERIAYARTGYESMTPGEYADALITARHEHGKQEKETH